MTKQYIDLVNGQLVFADPVKVTDTFAPTVRRSESRNGVPVVRWSAKQLVNTRLGKPGCDDACLTTPFVRKYEFSSATNVPETPAELAQFKKEIAQFVADLDVLIENHVLNGVKARLDLTFPDVAAG